MQKTLLHSLMQLSFMALILIGSSTAEIINNKANLSGARFKSEIRRELRYHDFKILKYKDYVQDEQKYFNINRLAISNVPIKSIYKINSKADFLLIINKNQKIIIESSQQNTPGSFDEKLPYIWFNAELNSPKYVTLFVYNGDGWRQGSIDWIRERARENEFLMVMDFTEFKNWVKNIS